MKYDPIRVSYYLLLPKEFKAKQECLSIQNNNEKCFIWSILALLHPVQRRNHWNNVSKYQEYEHELNMSGIYYSVDINNIGKFEHQNNNSVSLYGCKGKKIFPLRITTVTIARDHVDLSIMSILFAWLHQWRDIEKPYERMQVTRGAKNQVPRSWWQEGAWQSQVHKNRIPTTFTFCHLRRFRKHIM